MPIISVIDNENSRWKRKEKKTSKQGHKRTSGTEGIVKEWEPNDFVMGLSKVFSNEDVKLL